MDAYFNALQINPRYIRARYNLAIACIQIGQYREAAEHLLGALSIQKTDLEQVQQVTQQTPEAMHLGQSNSVWSTLRLLIDTYVRRPDLVASCDAQDLEAFRKDFDF